VSRIWRRESWRAEKPWHLTFVSLDVASSRPDWPYRTPAVREGDIWGGLYTACLYVANKAGVRRVENASWKSRVGFGTA
jgi:hypothetical protein